MNHIANVAIAGAALLLLAGCALIPSPESPHVQGGSTVNDVDDAYRQLDDIQQGLSDALGVEWGEPTAIGPVPCDSADDKVEMWLDRPATSSRSVEETLSLARDYLSGLGLLLDAEGFEEYEDGSLVADRVTARHGSGDFLIEVRAATNGVVQVTGVSDCVPGTLTDSWVPPSN